MAKDGVLGGCYAVVELEGARYAVIREAALVELARRADVMLTPKAAAVPARLEAWPTAELDRSKLALRLRQRRRRSGVTQVELARRAGIRVETLNRLERGHTTPDFSTVRKLVEAMNRIEADAHDSAESEAAIVLE